MYTYKTLVRDKLVENTAIQSLFNAATTGSCRVNMENLYVTASYPQILIGYDGGETTPNMDADTGRITLTVESQEGSGLHSHKELGQFRSAIMDVIDDTSLQSNTAVCYHLRKFSETTGFDEDKKVYWLRLSFEGQFKQNFSFP